MKIMCCEKCGGGTPEGFRFCPECMAEAGAGQAEIEAVSGLLEILNIISIGDTGASKEAAIESILNIAKKLEGVDWKP